MRYTEFKVGEREFKLRLGAGEIVNLEKKLGKNPLDILMNVEKGELPKIGDTLTILHAAMQKFHHGMTMEKVYQLYDEYVDEGNTYTDLIPVILEVFKVSGFFKEAQIEGK
ncbi:hypothetical protein SAMN02745883_00691 [Caminicella sporogenes DSM 14501]|uniref:Phage tail assembly chaperone protein, TAC n=1 Tax=Caminicella sporogenes DSM 14501 TaxID=1121266 RepID=A0A1M6MXW8_9FIRM|nr:DUF6096 family protein [Caminicella sporogenes]RKD22455.1 hypothetical protein BET04_05330 [Caminicella sporogenes]SHJ88183.1 hypothetical protein SAMN02745883_00691 [Caminicella sporogenes DSM 14501]